MKAVYVLIALGLAAMACSMAEGPAAPAATQAPAETPLPTLPPQPSPTQTALPLDIPTARPTTAPLFDLDSTPRELVADLIAHSGSVRRNVTYCTAGGVDLKMDVYSPRDPVLATPLVIFIHGGGWSEGDKAGGAYLYDAPALLDAGFTVASLNYRMAPGHPFPAMIEDVKCAVRAFRANAGEYGIDPNRIGVWGTSAGGHLANLLGTTDEGAGFESGEYLDQSSRVQAVLDMYGPADLTVDFSNTFADLRESVFGDFDRAQASPINHVTPDDPPFLILQGDLDLVVPVRQSLMFYERLAAAGVDVQLVVVQGGRHGFDMPGISPSRAEISTMILEFFQARLKQG
jgi:acetyl esterase/lipase